MTLFSSTYNNNSRVVSGTAVVFSDDVFLLADTSTAPVTIPLQPIPSGKINVQYRLYVKDNSNNAAINNITITVPVGYKINNQSSYVISTNSASVCVIITGNTNYLVFGVSNSTKVFANATARAASVPDFVGQLGVQIDTSIAYTSNGLSAGNWVAIGGGTSGNTTKVFIDATARATSVPDFQGQLGVQEDNNQVYISASTTVGDWNLISNTQLQSDTYSTASGTNTYTTSLTPDLNILQGLYIAGNTFRIKFTNGNTGASTININGIGAASLVKNGSVALVSGDIVSGGIYEICYDGTNFQLLNPKIPPFPSLSGYVPYSGATTNLNMGGYNVSLGHIIGDSSLSSTNNTLYAGGSGSGSSCSVLGTDLAGNITLNTGTSLSGNSNIVSINFGTNYGSIPSAVLLTPANAAAAKLLGNSTQAPFVDISSLSTSSFTIKSNSVALDASTTYKFYFVVIQ